MAKKHLKGVIDKAKTSFGLVTLEYCQFSWTKILTTIKPLGSGYTAFVESISKLIHFYGRLAKNASARTAHVKSCAQKKGVPTEKLLEILSLERRQAEERRALGLRSLPLSSTSGGGGAVRRRGADPARARPKNTQVHQ